MIETDLIECLYAEKMTEGKAPRIRRGAELCRICERVSCEFKPKLRKPKRGCHK